jgi:hypothetical protein
VRGGGGGGGVVGQRLLQRLVKRSVNVNIPGYTRKSEYISINRNSGAGVKQ